MRNRPIRGGSDEERWEFTKFALTSISAVLIISFAVLTERKFAADRGDVELPASIPKPASSVNPLFDEDLPLTFTNAGQGIWEATAKNGSTWLISVTKDGGFNCWLNDLDPPPGFDKFFLVRGSRTFHVAFSICQTEEVKRRGKNIQE